MNKRKQKKQITLGNIALEKVIWKHKPKPIRHRKRKGDKQ